MAGLGALIVGLVVISSSWAQDSCQYGPGVRGICRDIRLCPSVLSEIRNRLRAPVICRVVGRFPVVCCPSATNPTSPQLDISEPSGFADCGKTTAGFSIIGDVRFQRSVATHNQPQVVGGQDTQPAAWPWMALLGFREASGSIDWFCAGVLINNQWILSAAHCVDERTVNIVRLGEYDYANDNDGAPHQDFDVEAPIRHPEYAKPQAYNDLALLKLTQRVTFQSFIQPVCLPWGSETFRKLEGQQVTLTGWGHTLFGGSGSSVLQEVRVTVFPSDDCDKSYQTISNYQTTWPRGIGSESICSGDRQGGKDACQGDSGGPIVSKDSKDRYTVAGIVSVGFGCGSVDYPGLYVNVRRPKYLAWIKKVAF